MANFIIASTSTNNRENTSCSSNSRTYARNWGETRRILSEKNWQKRPRTRNGTRLQPRRSIRN